MEDSHLILFFSVPGFIYVPVPVLDGHNNRVSALGSTLGIEEEYSFWGHPGDVRGEDQKEKEREKEGRKREMENENKEMEK